MLQWRRRDACSAASYVQHHTALRSCPLLFRAAAGSSCCCGCCAGAAGRMAWLINGIMHQSLCLCSVRVCRSHTPDCGYGCVRVSPGLAARLDATMLVARVASCLYHQSSRVATGVGSAACRCVAAARARGGRLYEGGGRTGRQLRRWPVLRACSVHDTRHESVLFRLLEMWRCTCACDASGPPPGTVLARPLARS